MLGAFRGFCEEQNEILPGSTDIWNRTPECWEHSVGFARSKTRFSPGPQISGIELRNAGSIPWVLRGAKRDSPRVHRYLESNSGMLGAFRGFCEEQNEILPGSTDIWNRTPECWEHSVGFARSKTRFSPGPQISGIELRNAGSIPWVLRGAKRDSPRVHRYLESNSGMLGAFRGFCEEQNEILPGSTDIWNRTPECWEHSVGFARSKTRFSPGPQISGIELRNAGSIPWVLRGAKRDSPRVHTLPC